MDGSAHAIAVLEPPAAAQFGLLEALLKEQQELSAVEKFALVHNHGSEPLQAKYYRDLIPATPPQPGQQYAFEVDLDACTGCKACVTACHTLNGLDEDETWRSVGLLTGTGEKPVFQMVTTACHHCLHPACMDGCPTMAYDKDWITGIVRHLDDQCIGCQYCVLKCPYDVPKYSPSRGIVRKCDMCSSRLAANEAPACVQACPSSAIRIKIVDQAEIAQRSAAGRLLPDCIENSYTQPSTLYKSRLPLPAGIHAADAGMLTPEDGHLPLVATLVFTQASAGIALFSVLFTFIGIPPPYWMAPLAAALGLSGLCCAPLHLGRPLYGFRAVLGFRTSWLSREIIAFGVYGALIPAYAAIPFCEQFIATPGWLSARLPSITLLMGGMSVSAGIAAVLCSAMIYIDTRRPFWCSRYTLPRFFGTLLVAGCGVGLMASLWDRAQHSAVVLASLFAALSTAKLAVEALFFKHLASSALTQDKRSALLMSGPLRATTTVRFACGVLGGPVAGLLALLWNGSSVAVSLGIAAVVLTLVGELFERHLFFAAAVRLKMPGGLMA